MKILMKTTGLGIIVITLLVLFSSCTKTADGNLTQDQQDKNLEAISLDDKDFTEFDEDLSTVDYKEFYEQLAPHGEWIQITPEEAGIKPKTAGLQNSEYKQFSLFNLLGFNDAYAADDLNAGMVYVWKPSADLVVTKVEGTVPVYVPYTNGQWINTDAGWYFKAPTPAEETVSHHGRWVNSPSAGWLWVPGRVWAPAWVDWKQNDSYVSWAPLPPSVYVVNGTMNAPVIDDNNYVIVEKKYFLEPNVYRYNNVYYANGDKIITNEMTRPDGIIIVNNKIVNRGPDVNIFREIYGRNIDIITIQHVNSFNSARYTEKDYYVYTPKFKKYKNKENKKFTVNEPKSFKKFEVWKSEKNENKEYRKEEKEIKKELKKEEKEFKKENKSNDNDMKNGKKQNEKYDGKKQDNNNGGTKNNNNNGNKGNGNENKKGKK